MTTMRTPAATVDALCGDLSSIRAGSTSITSIAAPAIVAASGWAPPIPPRPAVKIVRPANSDVPKCFSPAAAKV